MTTDLRAPSTGPGRRTVGEEVSGLIRRREYAEAEAALVDRLTEHPGPVATACRGLSSDSVEIVDWEAVAAAVGRASAQRQEVTAVGLDLSNFSDADGFEWWDKDPVVEYALYDDSNFSFSTATRRQMQQAAVDHPAPWTGHRLAGPHGTIGVRGLRALNGALLRNEAGRPWDFGPDGRSYDDDVAMLLGGWWLVLRFHQAVARDWPEVGPVLGVPLLVGQHGTGPWQVSVFVPADAAAPDPGDRHRT
jgi:hypothetical protein